MRAQVRRHRQNRHPELRHIVKAAQVDMIDRLTSRLVGLRHHYIHGKSIGRLYSCSGLVRCGRLTVVMRERISVVFGFARFNILFLVGLLFASPLVPGDTSESERLGRPTYSVKTSPRALAASISLLWSKLTDDDQLIWLNGGRMEEVRPCDAKIGSFANGTPCLFLRHGVGI